MLDRDYLDTAKVKGRTYYYYRRDGKRTRLPDPSAADFLDRYNEVHEKHEKKARGPAATGRSIVPGSFGALTAEFRASPEFRHLAATTQRDYGWHLDRMDLMWGDLKPTQVTRRAAMKYKSALSGTPRQANYAMSVLRLVFNFGEDNESPGVPVGYNPARRPKRLKGGEGYVAWPLEHMEAFCNAHKDDDTAMAAFYLGLLAGQPRGDVIARNRTHWNGTELVAARAKNGEPIWVHALPQLRALLNRLLAGQFMVLVRKDGTPFTERYFSLWFRDLMTAAGIPATFHFHGLRVTAAEILSEFCDDGVLQAIFGWRTAAMAQHYRRRANRRKKALKGMSLWEQNQAGLPNFLLSGPK